MTERDLDTHPYSPDEQRVASFLFECGVGGGDDPIGFIMASHAYLAAQLAECKANLMEAVREQSR